MNFTPEQQQVIDLREKNILVAAAAGSGKTATLVERIVRMVCDEEHPLDIDRLLVVTFTKAAAAEMRERVHKGIAEQLKAHPESHHIQRQYTLVHRAQICTIDSFCQSVLRNHFQEIGLEPDFRAMDEGERKLLFGDVLNAVLEEQYALASGGEAPEGVTAVPGFAGLVEHFCPGGGDAKLVEAVTKLYDFADSFPWPEDFLEARKEDYRVKPGEDFASSTEGQFLTRYLHGLLQGYAEEYEKLREICNEPDGPYMYGDLFEQEAEQVQRMAEARTPEEIRAELDRFIANAQRLPGKKDDSVNPEKREAAQKGRAALRKAIGELQKDFFGLPEEVMTQRSEAVSRVAEALLELTIRFRKRFLEEKKDKHLVDFADMEHFALDVLMERTPEGFAPTGAALEYREHFSEIMIDEYQDSNLVQEQILSMISGESVGRYNRFMVGDVKQSIYGFRQARPDLFLEKYNRYGIKGPEIRIDLAKNFRSRPEVVETANAVFRRIMRADLCGIEYDDRAALYAEAKFAPAEGNESELLLFDKEIKDDLSEDGDAAEAEARIIASRVKELLGTHQVAAGRDPEDGLRPIRAKDIVILHRSAGTVADAYRKVFEEEGLALHCSQQKGYFRAREVKELLNLLRVINNPGQDIPLYGVLTSRFGGFTEDEIARIRGSRRKMSLVECLRQVREQEPKADDFLKYLETLRFRATYLTIRELLQQILDETDYLDYVTALPGGLKRRANVEMLLVRASDYEKTSYLGLFHFIRYIDELEKHEADPGEAEVLDENADVVRLMTVHKSKGLEFPVVFLAGFGKKIRFADTQGDLLIDGDLGLGMGYFNPETRQKSATSRLKILSGKKKLDILAEEMRLLYVGMTRPREKMIMVGGIDATSLKKRGSEERLSFHKFASATTWFSFILPILDSLPLQIRTYDAEGIEISEAKEQIRDAERITRLSHADAFADGAKLEELERIFRWQYAYGNLQKLYAKTTVSELKMAAMAERDEGAYHSMEEREHEAYVPDFAREKGPEHISGTTRGNAYHRTMEILNFESVLGAADSDAELHGNLESFLKEVTASGRLKKEYREALNLRTLETFLQSDLAKRMLEASRRGTLRREQPFVYGLSATRLSEDLPDETVLIQGIIDAYFEEGDGIVLLDYKTDSVPTMEALHERYDAQLEYYQEALERLTGKPVKEKLLYSFHLGQSSVAR